MPKCPVQHTTGPGQVVKETPLKNANLQWREQRIYPDATRCKTGCCRTGTKQHCFQKWKCDCHKTEVTK